MRIRRLGWSGIEIELGEDTLLIDYILDTSELPLREGAQPFPRASEQARAIAGIVTHLHSDHADPVALAAALRDGVPVFRLDPVIGSGGILSSRPMPRLRFKLSRLTRASWTPGPVTKSGLFRSTQCQQLMASAIRS